MDSVFRFFKFARRPVRAPRPPPPLPEPLETMGKKTPAAADEPRHGVCSVRSREAQADFASAGGSVGGGGGEWDNAVEDSAVAAGDKTGGDKAGGASRACSRMMSSVMSIAVESKAMDSKLKVADFDLLKVVGKGAFGKVMWFAKRRPRIRMVSLR